MSDGVAAGGGPDVGWRMLHPASLLVNVVPRLLRLLGSFWPLLLLAWLGRDARGPDGVELLLLGGVLASGVVSSALHWATLRYRVTEGMLEVQTGLLNRQTRQLTAGSVQDVELVASVFHRVAGLVEVRIQTASGLDVEGQLSALDLGEAERVVAALRRETPVSAEARSAPLHALTPGDLALHALTAVSLGPLIAILALGQEVVALLWVGDAARPGELPDVDMERLSTLSAVPPAALIVAVIALALLAGALPALFRHAGFALRREGEALVVAEGLFTRRRVVVRPARLQRLVVAEPILRRALGFATLALETAAVRAGRGGLERAVVQVPVVRTERMAALFRELLSEDARADLDAPLQPPPPAARVRAIVQGTLRGLALAGAIAAVPPWTAWDVGWLALVPASVALGLLDVAHQGTHLGGRVLVVRRGWWRRETVLVARARVQAATVRQGPFLARYGLAVVVVRVAGSGVALPLLQEPDARRLVGALLAGEPAAASVAERAPEPVSAPAEPRDDQSSGTENSNAISSPSSSSR